MAFMRRQVVDAFPLEENVSLFRIHKAADDTQRRCFSAAGRTEESDEFLVVDVQVLPFQKPFSFEFHHDVLEADDSVAHFASPFADFKSHK